MSNTQKSIYFVTGIGTDVGKTVCSAIIVEALQADYWKPVQAGGLDFTDTMRVQSLISNETSVFHPEQFRLNAPMSPHAAARLDQVSIHLHDFKLPETNNTLIVEGAGGLMVPLNDQGDCVIDLIKNFRAKVILVSRIYLGSINHTLLSAEALKNRNIEVAGILFNGPVNEESESVITTITGYKNLGHIPDAEHLKPKFISEQAARIKEKLIH